MFKLLVLSCLLFSCLADPFGLPSWLRESARRLRHPRGCADRAEGWRACARLNDSSVLAPHSSDCSLFFYCSGLGRPACRRCPAGLHFNPQLQVCDWPSEVECKPRPPRPPRPPCGNGTTPYPTTTDEDASVTVTDYPTTTPEESTTDSYPTTTELSPTTTELPSTTTELPSTTTELPPTTTELPSTTTELPSTTTELPSTTTELPSTEPSPTTSSWFNFWGWGRK